MEKSESYIIFIIIATVAVLALMIIVVADLLLIYRNKQLKYRNELLALNSKLERTTLEVTNEVTEQVFSDIADELHNNVCQTLTLAVIHINQAEVEKNPLPNHILESRDTIRQALTDIRNLSHLLSKEYWLNFDIHQALKALEIKLISSGKIKVNFDVDPLVKFNSKDHEIIVIRILQEMILNSLKHSNASLVEIKLRNSNNGLGLWYSDNGKGFLSVNMSEGLGLKTMKQRLSLLKAKYHINSENGFKFEAEIPMKLVSNV